MEKIGLYMIILGAILGMTGIISLGYIFCGGLIGSILAIIVLGLVISITGTVIYTDSVL